MAHLRDFPQAVRAVGCWSLFKQVWREVNEDNLFAWAAALAYAWVFAIFPFFIFLLALLPFLPRSFTEQAQHSIHQLVDQLPRESAKALWDNVQQALNHLLRQPRHVMLYAGLILALWAASGGTSMIMTAMDRCYELKQGRSFIHQRLVALGMTLLVIVMMLLIICLIPVASVFENWLMSHHRLGNFPKTMLIAFDVFRWLLAAFVLLSMLTLIYNTGPNIRQKFHWLTPGGAFCIIVWVLLGFGFKFYIDTFGARSYDLTYGTVGGVVILLLLFYLDALVMLIGAELNSEIDFIVLGVPRGSRDFTKAENAQKKKPPAPEKSQPQDTPPNAL